MNRIHRLLPLSLLTATTLAAAFDSSEWEFQQSVAVDHSGPVRLTVPAETLDAARSDLADLRLLDADGTEVPFVVLSGATAQPFTERIPTQARIESRTTVVEFGLAKRQPVQVLRIETPSTVFTKAASVEIVNDVGQWERVIDSALVFRLRGGMEHLDLDLRGLRTDTLRLLVHDGSEPPIPITAVTVECGGAEAEPLVELPVTIIGNERDAGTTRLTLDLGLRHRPIAGLTIAAHENVFQRPARVLAQQVSDGEVVEEQLASGTFARLHLPGSRTFERLTLPVEKTAPTAHLELRLDDGDSPALTEVRVTARLHRVAIGFEARGSGTYTLLAGAPAASAPRYDLAAFADDWGRLPPTEPAASPRTTNSGFNPRQQPVDVPTLAGPIEPSRWRHKRPVVLTEPGAQILELDPAALAQCRADLGDIRLVRDERQVPYLLERTSRQRAIEIPLVPAPDPKQPTIGRWALTLPQVGLPLRTLRVVIREAVFARELVVNELVPDSRGQPWLRRLGSAPAQRRSADDSPIFDIPLSFAPQTDTLILELDHGDNAAFSPSRAEVLYPVLRLHFQATETIGYELWSGNGDAAAPRYDLRLAARRLLAAPQHIATLAPADTGPGRILPFAVGGPVARIAFWGALALVVALLVWLVAKLLPKPPAA